MGMMTFRNLRDREADAAEAKPVVEPEPEVTETPSAEVDTDPEAEATDDSEKRTPRTRRGAKINDDSQ